MPRKRQLPDTSVTVSDTDYLLPYLRRLDLSTTENYHGSNAHRVDEFKVLGER